MTTFSREMFRTSVEGSFARAEFKPDTTYDVVISPWDEINERENGTSGSFNYGGFECRYFQGTKDPSQTYFVLRIPMQVEGGEDPELVGKKLDYEIFVDFKQQGDGMFLDMAMGKNPGLATLRKVVGQSEGPWDITDLWGAQLRMTTRAEEAKDGNTYIRAHRIAARV